MEPEREIDDLGRVAQLEVELGHDIFAQPLEITVLHVAPIRSQMRRNPACTRALAQARRHQRIGLGILRVGHGGVAGLPQRGDVIEINAKMQSSHRFNDAPPRRQLRIIGTHNANHSGSR